ncbi:hypothetical protein GCM10010345_25090 [Streptomyces canarius]|uniref:Transposase n=1 Tax=Streptomyces canarius TaxID=285453 RepID=A0ABQ3CJ76_9ACTN|nr:hypothetical protein GCM10010345_25090 [Streptomyces canarius]
MGCLVGKSPTVCPIRAPDRPRADEIAAPDGLVFFIGLLRLNAAKPARLVY